MNDRGVGSCSVHVEAVGAGAGRQAYPLARRQDPVAQREQARERRDWAAADQIRAQIEDLGWQVRDTPEGAELEPL